MNIFALISVCVTFIGTTSGFLNQQCSNYLASITPSRAKLHTISFETKQIVDLQLINDIEEDSAQAIIQKQTFSGHTIAYEATNRSC